MTLRSTDRFRFFARAAARRFTRLAAAFVFLFSLRAQAAPPQVFILGDMEKPTGNDAVADTPFFFSDGQVRLHAAGNETVAFQLLLRAGEPQAGLDVRVSDLAGPAAGAAIPAAPNIQLFLAHYVATQDASYSWGPGGGGALPWRGRPWPDALLPFTDPYDPAHPPVAAPFAIDPAAHRNQAVWVDLFIPPGQPAGLYRGTIELLQNARPFKTIPLALTVHPFSLPAASHVDAFGELYRENGLMFDSGVKFATDPERDWAVYARYVQMAHAHRFLALHRAAEGPLPQTLSGQPAASPTDYWSRRWNAYTPYVKQILDGSLFTARAGYVGPSPGTPPSFFPAPFGEALYGAGPLRAALRAGGGRLDPKWMDAIKNNAAAFIEEAGRQDWGATRFFAYIMDEVDGAQDEGENRGDGLAEAASFHGAMRQIQDALDAGTSGTRRIHLLWTSHADAARWAGTPADLSGVISWWCPNGDAVNVKFYQERAARGQTVWFYHSGQPAIGNHSINQTGIDLRLWGLLCARYGVQGSFWWSMMCFSKPWSDSAFNPYASPSYKDGDNRWGNGVLFYPGSRLTMAGCARNIAGPVSSLRMKAYRRGLQDDEYVWLARQRGKRARADELLLKLIPKAFGESAGPGKPGAWSQNVDDYYQLREDLARLIILDKGNESAGEKN